MPTSKHKQPTLSTNLSSMIAQEWAAKGKDVLHPSDKQQPEEPSKAEIAAIKKEKEEEKEQLPFDSPASPPQAPKADDSNNIPFLSQRSYSTPTSPIHEDGLHLPAHHATGGPPLRGVLKHRAKQDAPKDRSRTISASTDSSTSSTQAKPALQLTPPSRQNSSTEIPPTTRQSSSSNSIPTLNSTAEDDDDDTRTIRKLRRRESEPKKMHKGVPMSRTSTGSVLPGYKRGVAFDTFEAADDLRTGGGTGVDYSFTLKVRSDGYKRTRVSREYLAATDLNEYSVHALNWGLGNLIDDGDEIVVLRVIEPGTQAHAQWMSSPEEAKEEAQHVLDEIMAKNSEDIRISIIVEFVIGKVQETIHRMIKVYGPDALLVGTKGRSDSLLRTAFIGSTSKYCLSTSPVPVIVVRPERKVRKSVEARRARSSYHNLVHTSNSLPDSRRVSSSSREAVTSPDVKSPPVSSSSMISQTASMKLDMATLTKFGTFGLLKPATSKKFKRFETAPS